MAEIVLKACAGGCGRRLLTDADAKRVWCALPDCMPVARAADIESKPAAGSGEPAAIAAGRGQR